MERDIPFSSGAFLVATDGVGELALHAMMQSMPAMLAGLLAPVRINPALRSLPLLVGLANLLKREPLRANGLYVDKLTLHRGGATVTVGASFTGAKGGAIEVRLNLLGRPLRKSSLYLLGYDRQGESDDVVRLTHSMVAPVLGVRRATIPCTLAHHLVPLRAYELRERGNDDERLLEDVKVHAPRHMEMLNPHFEQLEAGVRFKMKLCLDHPGRCVERNSIILGTNTLKHGHVKLDAKGRSIAFAVSFHQSLNARLPEYAVQLQISGNPTTACCFTFRPERRGGTHQSASFLLVIAQAMVTLLGHMQVGKSLEHTTEISLGRSYSSLAKDPLMMSLLKGHVRQVRKLLKNLSADGWSLANVSLRKAASSLTPRHYTAPWCFNLSDQLKAAALVSEAIDAFLARYSLPQLFRVLTCAFGPPEAAAAEADKAEPTATPPADAAAPHFSADTAAPSWARVLIEGGLRKEGGNPAETPEGHWDSDFDWSGFDGNEAYDTAGVAAADAAAAAAAADGAGAAVADGAAAAANDEADAGESDGAAAAADDEADAGESDGDEAEEMVGEGEADSEADKELCLAITR